MSKESLALFVFLMAVGIGMPSTAHAQQEDCGTAQSNEDRAQCADRELASAEKDLKEAFAQAVDQYASTADRNRETAAVPNHDRDRQVRWEQRMRRDLNLSQKASLDYRQSACGTVAEMYDGGTIAAVGVPLCKAEMTRARTKFLRDYFDNDL
jgi:uncharacterized protein YecT (DUF1311 family)